MKKAVTLLFAVVALVLVSAVPALAVSLLSETFDAYNTGGLVAMAGGNWASHSGTIPTDIQVLAAGKGKYVKGDMAATADDNRTFAQQDSSAKTYACFRVRIPSIASGAPRTTYFAHFKDTGTFNFAARVFVAPSGTTFSFGLSVAATAMSVQWATALNYDQWYTVAISYNGATGTDRAELWVDPVNEASTKITATATGITSIFVSSFALRQSNAGSGTLWKWDVDDIGVGTTFADACTSGPTPTRTTTWGRVKSIYR